jgi:YhcH/YjgK/YiaL family protein
MIHAPLARAARYHAVHPLLAPAFAWLAKNDAAGLPDGYTSIIDGQLFVCLESSLTAPADSKLFESHRRYIDLQVVLSGPHVMAWADADRLAVVEDFKPEGDIRFHAEPPPSVPCSLVHVGAGEFVIFFPEDAHKPSCTPHADPAPQPYSKALFKLAAAVA